MASSVSSPYLKPTLITGLVSLSFSYLMSSEYFLIIAIASARLTFGAKGFSSTGGGGGLAEMSVSDIAALISSTPAWVNSVSLRFRILSFLSPFRCTSPASVISVFSRYRYSSFDMPFRFASPSSVILVFARFRSSTVSRPAKWASPASVMSVWLMSRENTSSYASEDVSSLTNASPSSVNAESDRSMLVKYLKCFRWAKPVPVTSVSLRLMELNSVEFLR